MQLPTHGGLRRDWHAVNGHKQGMEECIQTKQKETKKNKKLRTRMTTEEEEKKKKSKKKRPRSAEAQIDKLK